MALAIGVTGQQFALMSIRRLDTADHDVARLIRLRALRDSPAAYGSTYEREVRFRQKSGWTDWPSRRTQLFCWSHPNTVRVGLWQLSA
jgi:hypothetical protein